MATAERQDLGPVRDFRALRVRGFHSHFPEWRKVAVAGGHLSLTPHFHSLRSRAAWTLFPIGNSYHELLSGRERREGGRNELEGFASGHEWVERSAVCLIFLTQLSHQLFVNN